MVASRLIALGKCPGVCPIGDGEAIRQIIGKAVCLIYTAIPLKRGGR